MIVLRELAPAKINLYLHITGKRADGYHLLDSLVAFGDAHDKIEVSPAEGITCTIEGPYAAEVSAKDNTVVTAARTLHAKCKAPGAALTLHKNLPTGAGLGGGSSDAAATLRLLCRFWRVKPTPKQLHDIALSIGADVPVCLKASSSFMSGIGEILEPGPVFAGTHVLLVWPGKKLLTKDTFAALKGAPSKAPRHPHAFASPADMIEFLNKTQNDLQLTSIKLLPEIATVLDTIKKQEGCQLSRMSGSGSACFGIFINQETAAVAAVKLSEQNPSWWVKAAGLR